MTAPINTASRAQELPGEVVELGFIRVGNDTYKVTIAGTALKRPEGEALNDTLVKAHLIAQKLLSLRAGTDRADPDKFYFSDRTPGKDELIDESAYANDTQMCSADQRQWTAINQATVDRVTADINPKTLKNIFDSIWDDCLDTPEPTPESTPPRSVASSDSDDGRLIQRRTPPVGPGLDISAFLRPRRTLPRYNIPSHIMFERVTPSPIRAPEPLNSLFDDEVFSFSRVPRVHRHAVPERDSAIHSPGSPVTAEEPEEDDDSSISTLSSFGSLSDLSGILSDGEEAANNN